MTWWWRHLFISVISKSWRPSAYIGRLITNACTYSELEYILVHCTCIWMKNGGCMKITAVLWIPSSILVIFFHLSGNHFCDIWPCMQFKLLLYSRLYHFDGTVHPVIAFYPEANVSFFVNFMDGLFVGGCVDWCYCALTGARLLVWYGVFLFCANSDLSCAEFISPWTVEKAAIAFAASRSVCRCALRYI